MEDEMDMDEELEREIEEEDLCVQLALERDANIHQPITKVLSLPADFTFTSYQSLQSSCKYHSLYHLPKNAALEMGCRRNSST